MLRETILIIEDDAATRAFLAERIKAILGLQSRLPAHFGMPAGS